jgi:hypothetical protein
LRWKDTLTENQERKKATSLIVRKGVGDLAEKGRVVFVDSGYVMADLHKKYLIKKAVIKILLTVIKILLASKLVRGIYIKLCNNIRPDSLSSDLNGNIYRRPDSLSSGPLSICLEG